MTKHTVKYHRKMWDTLLACICPQILGIFTPRLCRKYAKMPGAHTHRLVWRAQPNAPRTNSINPHFKEY